MGEGRFFLPPRAESWRAKRINRGRRRPAQKGDIGAAPRGPSGAQARSQAEPKAEPALRSPDSPVVICQGDSSCASARQTDPGISHNEPAACPPSSGPRDLFRSGPGEGARGGLYLFPLQAFGLRRWLREARLRFLAGGIRFLKFNLRRVVLRRRTYVREMGDGKLYGNIYSRLAVPGSRTAWKTHYHCNHEVGYTEELIRLWWRLEKGHKTFARASGERDCVICISEDTTESVVGFAINAHSCCVRWASLISVLLFILLQAPLRKCVLVQSLREAAIHFSAFHKLARSSYKTAELKKKKRCRKRANARSRRSALTHLVLAAPRRTEEASTSRLIPRSSEHRLTQVPSRRHRVARRRRRRRSVDGQRLLVVLAAQVAGPGQEQLPQPVQGQRLVPLAGPDHGRLTHEQQRLAAPPPRPRSAVAVSSARRQSRGHGYDGQKEQQLEQRSRHEPGSSQKRAAGVDDVRGNARRPTTTTCLGRPAFRRPLQGERTRGRAGPIATTCAPPPPPQLKVVGTLSGRLPAGRRRLEIFFTLMRPRSPGLLRTTHPLSPFRGILVCLCCGGGV
ncbi:hypothetical protein HPB48_026498 [Haemaphysalis longicornis]|uniref:Uncharacterized protein n=1 Tax=Haemaphysalis longicornis TaxID=44386 RepID=A0A9J6HBJ8_HAELO|nr:hypothetical protein HPB48_026498 [Haemaphysalis longicornis]